VAAPDDTRSHPVPALTVRCIACGEDRPLTADPCPACGADPYRDPVGADGEADAVGAGDGPPFE
jgi:hypothetical protein